MNSIKDGFFQDFSTGAVISRRCPPGRQLRLGMDACAVTMKDADAVLHMPPPQEIFTAPLDAETFILSLRDIQLVVGFKDLISYRSAGAPGRLFRLGLYAELTLSIGHIRGFSNLLGRAGDITRTSLFPMLYAELQPLVIAAITGVLGSDPPEYSQILDCRAALGAAIEQALFEHLYPYGLCIRPHSFRIQGFTKPAI